MAKLWPQRLQAMWFHSPFGSVFGEEGVRRKREMTKKVVSGSQCSCFLVFLNFQSFNVPSKKPWQSVHLQPPLSLFFHLKQHFTSDRCCMWIQQVISVREAVLMLAGLWRGCRHHWDAMRAIEVSLDFLEVWIRRGSNLRLTSCLGTANQVALTTMQCKSKNILHRCIYLTLCAHLCKNRCLRVCSVHLSLYRWLCASLTVSYLSVYSCYCVFEAPIWP